MRCSHCEDEFRKCFQQELFSIPTALFEENNYMSKTVNFALIIFNGVLGLLSLLFSSNALAK